MAHRILLIDDDFVGIEPIASGLCAEGHYVRMSTRAGDNLLQLVEMVRPDVLIIDPAMEGDDLNALEMTHRAHPDLEIIAISQDQHLLKLASERATNHVLAKPISAERLNLLKKIASLPRHRAPNPTFYRRSRLTPPFEAFQERHKLVALLHRRDGLPSPK